MINYFTQLWKDYNDTQKQLADMGIIQVILPLQGVYTHIDKEQFQIYQDKLKESLAVSKTD